MARPLHIIIVEDSEDDALLILLELQRGGYSPDPRQVTTAAEMKAALDQESWDIVIADYNMPSFSAPAALKLLQERGLDIPFIVVSGSIGEDTAVALMKAGAHDYLMKDNLARLLPAVERELREAEERRQRRQAEQSLRSSEERFRTLIENALDIIAVVNPDGTLNYVSPSIERLLGYNPSRSIGQNAFDFIHPEETQTARAAFESAMRDSSQRITIEFRLKHHDGSWRTLEAVGQRFVELDGIARIVVNARDIGDRKQAEEIRKALQREKELHDLKSSFVSMVSHEFRTPLSVIGMCIGLLERFSNVASEDRKQQYLERIRSASKRMTQLLDDVLFLGKTEADKQEFKPSPLDLVEFCRNVVEEVQLITGSQHTIRFLRTTDMLPACMDELLLRHILINLLSNSIKYSPNSDTVVFELTCEPASSHLLSAHSSSNSVAIFQIQDRGIGIPESDQRHLFDSFQRGSNVGKISGTGLGLAIVKRSVDLHQGTIRVQSEIGVGTTFTVALPLYAQETHVDQPVP
ncbi:MAG: ATP-binding protein [Leptolyngbyaceae cyanobacterium bins.59]|nr:ATP-binding protein [Leptolyngbyaceae cyanobacterium bins.59]